MKKNSIRTKITLTAISLTLSACQVGEADELLTSSKQTKQVPSKVESEEIAGYLDNQAVDQRVRDSTVLSDIAQQGKPLFAACQACHNPELEPALAPPMFGVQRRYKRQYPNNKDFIESLASFVKKPTKEKAIMKHAVKKMGVMPANVTALTDADLVKLATYIYEEKFSFPCSHWKNAVRVAENSGDGDNNHIKKNKANLLRFCP